MCLSIEIMTRHRSECRTPAIAIKLSLRAFILQLTKLNIGTSSNTLSSILLLSNGQLYTYTRFLRSSEICAPFIITVCTARSVNPQTPKPNTNYTHKPRTAQYTHSRSATKPEQAIIAVCSETHTKHTNALCGQNVLFLTLNLVVHTVISGLVC